MKRTLIMVYAPDGHAVEKRVVVVTENRSWDVLKAKLFSRYPAFEGRRMSAYDCSAWEVQHFNREVIE